MTVRMLTVDVTLRSELPPVPMWTYEGGYPGRTVDTVRGRRLRVAGENHPTGIIPATAVGFGLAGGPSPDLLSSSPCTRGFREAPVWSTWSREPRCA